MDLLEQNENMVRRHPWEVSRHRFFADILKQSKALESAEDILDVGSGDAWFSNQLLPWLKPDSHVTCWDSGYAGHPIFLHTHTDSRHLTFISEPPARRFNVILLLDVLEHIEQETEFLSRIVAQNLYENGTVLLSVPAWPILFSEHDVQLRHFRRYRPTQGRRLLKQSGLEIIREGGLFHSLLVPRAFDLLASSFGRKPLTGNNLGHWDHGPIVSTTVLGLLRTDNWISKTLSKLRFHLPGLSWWALCRKRSS